MSSGTLYRVALVRTDVPENISPPSSGFLRVIRLHSLVTVECPSIRLRLSFPCKYSLQQAIQICRTFHLGNIVLCMRDFRRGLNWQRNLLYYSTNLTFNSAVFACLLVSFNGGRFPSFDYLNCPCAFATEIHTEFLRYSVKLSFAKWTDVKSQSQSYVIIDGKSSSLSWCQAPILEPIITFLLLWGSATFYEGRACRLQLLRSLSSAAILGSGSRRTHILRCQVWDSCNLEDRVLVFNSQRVRWPSYTHRHWVNWSKVTVIFRPRSVA
jgi:hypothetical protein